jgi:hypothetical protein
MSIGGMPHRARLILMLLWGGVCGGLRIALGGIGMEAPLLYFGDGRLSSEIGCTMVRLSGSTMIWSQTTVVLKEVRPTQ